MATGFQGSARRHYSHRHRRNLVMASAYWCNPGGHAGADHIPEVSSAMLKWEVGAEQCVVQETEASRGAGVDFRGIPTTATQPCARMFSPGNRITWGHSETHLENVSSGNQRRDGECQRHSHGFPLHVRERVVAVMRRCLGASAPQQMSDRR